jgi:hypothetical protein
MKGVELHVAIQEKFLKGNTERNVRDLEMKSQHNMKGRKEGREGGREGGREERKEEEGKGGAEGRGEEGSGEGGEREKKKNKKMDRAQWKTRRALMLNKSFSHVNPKNFFWYDFKYNLHTIYSFIHLPNIYCTIPMWKTLYGH